MGNCFRTVSYTHLDVYKRQIEFREDLSNQKNDYLRNKIRNQIVPQLLETNENFLENFNKSVQYLEQTKNFVEHKILKIEKEIVRNEDNYFVINKKLLFDQSNFLQFEILRKFGFIHPEEIFKIKNAETGKMFICLLYTSRCV